MQFYCLSLADFQKGPRS